MLFEPEEQRMTLSYLEANDPEKAAQLRAQQEAEAQQKKHAAQQESGTEETAGGNTQDNTAADAQDS
jgi:hypothetical protein